MTTLPSVPTRRRDPRGALDPEQREVAACPSGPMCVLAGAGTGKTRAITHRIAYGVHSGAYQPQRVLAVTFTARAAGEMRTRLRDARRRRASRPAPSTPPRCASCTTSGRRPIGGAAPEVLPHKAPVVAEAARRGCGMQFDRTAIRDLAAEVEWAKVTMLTPESYAARARVGRP